MFYASSNKNFVISGDECRLLGLPTQSSGTTLQELSVSLIDSGWLAECLTVQSVNIDPAEEPGASDILAAMLDLFITTTLDEIIEFSQT